MSTAAVMLVKDEADVIEHVVRHLLEQVQELLVADNGSTDGTLEILQALAEETGAVGVRGDDEVGYWQARKTTALAQEALELGHQWVVPMDADEVWYANDGRTVAAWLSALAGDVMIVKADLYDHVPTAIDPPNENPLARIGWRKREHASLPKVACRLRPDLEIGPGNHAATTRGTARSIRAGLALRHFSWRSEDQYLRKIANGARAYAATDYPPDIGGHWRMHGDPEAPDFEERVREHFREWFFSNEPDDDDSLVYDPAPIGG